MLNILRFYSCFCLSDDFLVAKGDLKVEQTRMQMARGFPIYFLFLGSRNACFFLNAFSWKTQKHTGFIRFSAIRGGTFFDSFFWWFSSNLKNTSSGHTEHIEYSWGFICILVSGLGAGPAIGGIRWRFFFCINCRKSWEIVLFHKVFWFLVFNGFAFVFLSALARRKNTLFLRSKITRVL